MIAPEEYVDFLIESKLTQSQLLLLILLYYDRVDLINKYKAAFPTEDGTMIGQDWVNDLFKLGYLTREKDDIKLSDSFKAMFITPDRAVDAVYDIYPSFFISDTNVKVPLKSMDKKVFREIYKDKIMLSTKEHLAILEDIKYGKEHKLLNMGINKFLTSEHWKSIREERLKTGTASTKEIDDYQDF